MRKLFDDGRPMAPTVAVVQQLEAYGYKADAVRKWSAEKANIVLAAVKKEEGIAQRRAAEKARAQGAEPSPAPSRGFPVPMLRLQAAEYLRQPMTVDDLEQGIAYSLHNLCDSEIKRLGGYLVRLFAANSGFSPDHLERLSRAAGGDRSASGDGPDDAPAEDHSECGPGPETGV